MKLTMSFGHRLVQECNICGGTADEHKSSCPRHAMKQIHEIMMRSSFRCPSCHKGTTLVNRSDFIECRKCHDQFTTGAVYDGDAKIVFLGDSILAAKLPHKGKGDFPLLKRMRELAAAEKKALRKARL